MTLCSNVTDLDHWYVPVPRGWLRFPAGVDGWFAAQIVRHLDETHLRAVPVWFAFNTGMPVEAAPEAQRNKTFQHFPGLGRLGRNVSGKAGLATTKVKGYVAIGGAAGFHHWPASPLPNPE